MAHTIYQTKGVILSKKDFGEADKIFTIFTEEFGKITVIAQGVRHLKSKLRYNLELFSLAQICVLKSRVSDISIWRITEAEETNPFNKIKNEKEKTLLFSKIAKFLIRMIHGEEKNPELWDGLNQTLNILETEVLEKENLNALEKIVILRILYCLGYIHAEEIGERFIFEPLTKSLLLGLKIGESAKITSFINEAIKASHL